VLVSTACGGDTMKRVREATYPPSFHYITESEIRTQMGSLAVEVAALDAIMWRPEGPGAGDQAKIVEILKRMRVLTRDLKKGARSNHPRIDRVGPRLQRDIERALEGARGASPNYYYAGLVSGACTYCHEPRHGSTGVTPRVP
jgi:hypothetical protein